MTSAFEKAKKALEIKSVELRNFAVFIDEEIEASDIEKIEAIQQSFRTINKVKEMSVKSDDSVWYEYNFFYSVGVRLVEESENEDEQPLLQITATYNTVYKSEEKLEPGSLKAFSKENVGYHVWPYWREFVQSSCSRLNVPLIPMPLYFCSPDDIQSDE